MSQMEMFNIYVEISLILILTGLFSSNFTILLQQQRAYSQEDTATPTARSQPSLTNSEWSGIFFLLIIFIALGINEYIHTHGTATETIFSSICKGRNNTKTAS
jgi:NADH:ubiquinone oxidoreductase subunit 4 (subunit M)